MLQGAAPMCVCVRSIRFTLMPTFQHAGDLPTGNGHSGSRCPTKTVQSCREATRDAVLCTCNICVILKVYLAPWLRRCLCFLFFRATFSPLEGSRVLCEPKLIHEEPYPSRDLPVVFERISTLHLESKCVHPIRGESSGVPIV